jgi:hypothetical protein
LLITDLAQLQVSTHQSLLLRRPDIHFAEHQLASANADMGAAITVRLFRVSLNILLGVSSNSSKATSGVGADLNSLGSALSWTARDYGRTRARIGVAQARSDRSVLGDEQPTLVCWSKPKMTLAITPGPHSRRSCSTWLRKAPRQRLTSLAEGSTRHYQSLQGASC